MTSITIPDSVTSIRWQVFKNCTSLTSITIPNSVTSIEGYAFFGCCNMTKVTIPDSVTSIGKYAFSNCTSLTSVTIPNSVTSIGEGVFSRCDSLTSVTIPNSVTSIEGYVFYECCSMTKVTIPDSVTSIGKYAFLGCTSLSSVTIPNSVTSIGEGAFEGCKKLVSVTILAKSISIGKDAFKNSDPTFYIIEGSKAIDWAKVNNYDYDTFADGLSKKSLKLEAGETRRLTVYVQGKETTDVTWSSSNKKIATVKAGTVTAIKDGTCTITAKVKNGETLTCDVTVREAARLNKTKLSMKPGDTQTLRISGLHSRKVTWTSSDKKVATVKDGKVTAMYIGTCTITAQIKNGKKLTCKVTVTDEAKLSSTKLTISNIDNDRIKLTGGLNRKEIGRAHV